MDSAASSHWNPALRPDKLSDQNPSTDPESPILDGQVSEAAPQAEPISEQDAVDESYDKSEGADSLIHDATGDDSRDNATALTTDDVNAQAAPTEVAANHEEADDTPQGEIPETENNNIPQHTSRMSFARTVSHEVNWNDDDEPEWNLTRTGTDLFKSMPPNDRTNSFPPVPPLNHTEQPHIEPEAAIPEEYVEEQQHTHLETFDENLGPVGVDMPKELELEHDEDGIENGNHVVMGGAETKDATDAGFLEDAPLISPNNDSVTEDNAEKGKPDLFGDEDTAEDDDFFAGNGNAAKEDDFFAQIEEKGPEQELETPEQGATLKESLQEQAHFRSEVTEAGHIPTSQSASEATPEEVSKPTEALTEENGGDFWGELADEDEFLPDEPTNAVPAETTQAEAVDATTFLPSDDEGFLPSDDEGFLEDSDAEAPITPTAPPTAPPATTSRYLPACQPPNKPTQPSQSYFPAAVPPAPTPNIYAPPAPVPGVPLPAATPFAAPPTAPPTAPPAPTSYGYGAAPLPKPVTKAQSFADKSKGGYTSPYDLPMEVVKPKKRASLANLQKTAPGPNGIAPPPRSASLHSPLPPPPAASPKVPPPANFSQPPQAQKPKPQDHFFEDLPITTKPRPSSRHSNKSVPSPQPSPYGPPPPSGPPQLAQQPPAPKVPHVSSPAVGDIPNLVAPPRVNPYASLPSNPSALNPGVPAATSNRYSPAPPNGAHANGSIPPPAQSRYSPAPPATRHVSAGYAPSTAAPAPPVLPHQPRTSSPLAHFEISHEKARPSGLNHSDSSLSERRSSSSMYDPRLQRVPSLPPTREVEEDESQDQAQGAAKYAPSLQASPPTSRHGQLPYRSRNTPPPPSNLAPSPLSPPKRATSSHIPPAALNDFVPPPRSQTQSPGALYGNRNGKPVEAAPRPSSVHDPAPPRSSLYSAAVPPPVAASASTSPVISRSRTFSQNLNYIAPTDGRENDPLQRWRGAPLIAWGVGGTIVTMFPKDIPRYGVHQTTPMVLRSPGEVKVKNAKDIQPLEDRLAKFPGPLKGKSKKKEVIAWLSSGIEGLEQGLPTGLHALQHSSHDDKRAVERVLLWKILRLFVEHDGALEGNPTVEKALRDVLLPDADKAAAAPLYLNGGNTAGLNGLGTAATHSDAVDSSAVEQIRLHLQNGDAEKAVWTAVDKRLWGHALLLANALAPALYKQVSQEFVKKEVNLPGQNNESLAALYAVLSGNHEESIDELVPYSARTGHKLVSANASYGSTKDALEGLDKWRQTLGLILSNRSADDSRAINSLGNLLSGYGRAEAAHICFLFARTQTIFGGLDDPASHFVLLGSDHKRQAEQFAKEIEPLLLSEVYEYGQTLGGPNAPVSNPHLAAYKLQHALALAEYGFRDKALQYCEAIATAITAQTKRSPYHHPILETAVDDLMKRLKLAPKEESNSWIPKPSMNKVSDTMWNRFNKFVAGDDNDGSGQGSPHEESGPFARIAGGTPTISRPPSTNNLETFGAAAIPNYGVPIPSATLPAVPALSSIPPTKASSRYAPAAGNPYDPSTTYAPRSSMERSSGEYQRSSIDLPRQSSEFQPGYPAASNSYAPQYGQTPALPQQTPYAPVSSPPQTSAPSFGYEPLGQSNVPMNGAATGSVPSTQEPSQPSSNGGYQPYGYEPPSQSSYEPLSQNSYEPPSQTSNEEDKAESETAPATNTFEPPSYQPYGYEPPTYEPDSPPANDEELDEESKPKPKKKGIMYDDDEDDFSAPPKKPAEKTKEEKDRENAEMFRKAAEEDAKRAAEAAKQTKKGWGFSGWFGGGAKKDAGSQDNASSPNKPVRAKLGEANSFYYDPELKRWINKNASPEDNAPKKSAPPPPRSAPPMPRSASSSPAPPMATSNSPPMAIPGAAGPAGGRASAPPRPPMGAGTPPTPGTPTENGGLAPPMMMRSVSNTSTASAGGPPSRPTTSLSNSSSIDDLLAAAGPRKGGAKKARKSARYVDVMNQ